MKNLDVEGMKNKEIAETTAVAETTLKRRIKTIPILPKRKIKLTEN